MPKYEVYFKNYASSSVTVEAEDETEAFEKAFEEFTYPNICAQCSGWGRDWYLELGEWEPCEPPYDIFKLEE